jgi:hypothetical protein
MRKVINWLVLVLTIYVVFEFSSLFGLYLIKKIHRKTYNPTPTHSLSDTHKETLHKLLKNQPTYGKYSPELGWTIKENGMSTLFKSNSQGIRANREYRLSPPKNVVRISTFGDSFTHGDEVENKHTWQEKLNHFDSNLEVLNFGVNGYGLDQTFLRYQKDGIKFNSHIVLIGFLSENILRNINVFRPFYMPNASGVLGKPYFTLENDKLQLHPNPLQDLSQYQKLLDQPDEILPKLGSHDYFFKTRYKNGFFDFLPSVRLLKMTSYELLNRDKILEYDQNSYPFQLTTKIFGLFHETVEQNNSFPIIVVFPGKRDIISYRKNKIKRYLSLLNYFDTKNYLYIDIYDAFDIYGKNIPVKDLFINYHYSPLGNELVAKHIWQYLSERKLTTKQGIERLSQRSSD